MSTAGNLVACPICAASVDERRINIHLDSGCAEGSSQLPSKNQSMKSKKNAPTGASPSAKSLAPIFALAKAKRPHSSQSSTAMGDHDHDEIVITDTSSQPDIDENPGSTQNNRDPSGTTKGEGDRKRLGKKPSTFKEGPPPAKRVKTSSIAGNLRSAAPLAEKLRPTTLEGFIGHEHITSEDSLLRGLLEGGGLGSMILWGPAGCGKTTLARLLASRTNSTIRELSATSSGTAEVRSAFEEAKNTLKLVGKRTILFMDEIHRFNKAQQDLFLPYVEQGVVQLIGATTENPSFKLNNALLSRCRVFQLDRLTDDNIRTILEQAIARVGEDVELLPTARRGPAPSPLPTNDAPPNSEGDFAGPSSGSTTAGHAFPLFPQVTPAVIKSIASFALGDARTALSLLELVLTSSPTIQESVLLDHLKKSVVSRYDRSGDDRYDMISALHKSVRGSDGSAALYWLARMLTAGEDPLYVARRLVVIASEDVGLADNHALPLATATYSACTTIGMPECRINLAHCVAYLAEAPKSTRAYEAYARAEAAATADSTLSVPINIRNAPTGLMKDLGYGKGYLYNPGYRHPVHNTFLPLGLPASGDFLRKEGDTGGKEWNEDLLCEWEWKDNGGEEWEGRSVSKGMKSSGKES